MSGQIRRCEPPRVGDKAVIKPGALHGDGGDVSLTRMFWPAVAVGVIGLFMLVAGIGPLFLPIVVLLLGVGVAVASKRAKGRHSRVS